MTPSGKRQVGLEHQTAMWGTPRGSEWKGTWPVGSKSHLHRLNRHYLDAESEAFPPFRPVPASASDGPPSSPSTPDSRLRLNPRFVTWLMGWPLDWFDVTAWPFSEMASSPPRPLSRGERSVKG